MSGRPLPGNGRDSGRGASAPPPFLTGANYPWGLWEGKSNYGCDFGRNRWGSHTGVSQHAERVEADFRSMRDLGLDVVRWFVLCDGRAGVRFGEEGEVLGPDDLLTEDLDAAVAAARFSGMRLILVLLDYLWVVYRGPGAIGPGMVDRLFLPLFRRYGKCREVLAWELMNEPDWVVEGMNPDPQRVARPMGSAPFMELVAETSRCVHADTGAMFTVGTCRPRNTTMLDTPEAGLDVLQVHPYADFLGVAAGDGIAGRQAREVSGRLPVLVGEYPLGMEGSSGYLGRIRESGFAGALFWSYNPVDRFGIPGGDALRAAVLGAGGASRRV
jgi:hypothetical protein